LTLTMKKHVLIVDDEINLLRGLERMLRSLRRDWVTSFASSGREALSFLGRQPCDVLITDMRMPEMDGVALLVEVKRRHPRLVRIILSGQSDRNLTMKAVNLAHQYLAKPCDPETLIRTVEQACALREFLSDPGLREWVSRIGALPSLPTLYVQLMKELEDPEPSIQRVGDIVGRDVGMTAKILQLVNSAFFGICRHVSSPVQAVTLLGIETVRTLVLGMQVFEIFVPSNRSGFSIDALWNHSFRLARFCRAIAQEERRESREVDDAFMAGLLHDVGKLVLGAHFPERYTRVMEGVRRNGVPAWEAEREVFGTHHGAVGAYLMGLWGFPDPIVEGIAYHHTPHRLPSAAFHPAAAIHVANSLEHKILGQPGSHAVSKLNTAYLNASGILDRLPRWLAVCREAASVKGVE